MTPAILLQGTQSQNGFKTTLSLNTFNTGDENWWMTSEEKKKVPHNHGSQPVAHTWRGSYTDQAQSYGQWFCDPHRHQALLADQLNHA